MQTYSIVDNHPTSEQLRKHQCKRPTTKLYAWFHRHNCPGTGLHSRTEHSDPDLQKEGTRAATSRNPCRGWEKSCVAIALIAWAISAGVLMYLLLQSLSETEVSGPHSEAITLTSPANFNPPPVND